MDATRNDDTLSERPTLGRTVTEEKEPQGPFLPWTDEDAERETVKRSVSPEEMTLAKRYKVLRRLGEGGMGSVWLAEDLKLDGRKVAIKMLPAVLAGKKGAYRQVKQEALMAMKLSHPNIATVRAFEEEDGNPFLVMDYIDGTGLDDILAEKGKLSEEETLKLLGPVAAVLDYAHAKGVVHRDVKPGNVMVDKNGIPFVLDFGIAREIQEKMTRVTGKFSSGTLLYMSPEQLRGRAPKATQDVYSFAAMAYECLSGMPPFARGQVEYQIVNEPPEPLPEGAGSAALREGIMAGLAKNPEGRPRSCAEVLGLGEAAKRAREAQEAEEAKRRRQEAARLAQERARAEYEKRREEQALEAERAARKVAEEKARKAREEARERALEAMQEKQARGRVAGWTWFLFVVLLVGGIVAYGLWQQEHETSQAKLQQLQQEAEAHRKAQQEAEAKWKEAAEAQRRAQEEAKRKEEEEARKKLERQRAEAEAQRRAQEEAEQKAAEARQELERQRAEAEAQRRAQEEAERKAAAEAEAKAEQERQMKPSILLKATVNGREVAATVTEGLARSGLQTPVTVNLEVGGSYSFAAEYETEGKKFTGRTTVMAKDRGVTDAAVVLEEVKVEKEVQEAKRARDATETARKKEEEEAAHRQWKAQPQSGCPLKTSQIEAFLKSARDPRELGITTLTDPASCKPRFEGANRPHLYRSVEKPMVSAQNSSILSWLGLSRGAKGSAQDTPFPFIEANTGSGKNIQILVDTSARQSWLALDACADMSYRPCKPPLGEYPDHVDAQVPGYAGIGSKLVMAPQHVEYPVFYVPMDSGPLGPLARLERSADEPPLPSESLRAREKLRTGLRAVMGAEMLRAFDWVRIDYPGRRVHLSSSGPYKPPVPKAVAARLPMDDWHGRPAIHVRLDGVPAKAVLDTGGDFELSLPAPAAATGRLDLGSSTDLPQFVIPLATHESLGLPADFPPRVGSRLLARYIVTLDYKNRLVWLEDPELAAQKKADAEASDDDDLPVQYRGIVP